MSTLKKFASLLISKIFVWYYLKKYAHPKVINSYKTINQLVQNKKSITRFGDGEFSIIKGNAIKFQDYDKELAEKLVEILNCDFKNLLVGIPNIYLPQSYKKLTFQSKVFWMRELRIKPEIYFKLPSENKRYYDASVTRPYIRYSDETIANYVFKYLKELLKDEDLLIIEGRYSRLGVGNDLFEGAKSIQRILCPEKNAFSSYKQILDSAKRLAENKIVIISLGPTATVLAYDLFLAGYHTIDLGHIDLEYEWYIRKAKRRVPIPNKIVNELSNDFEEKDKNEKYETEIIKIIN